MVHGDVTMFPLRPYIDSIGKSETGTSLTDKSLGSLKCLDVKALEHRGHDLLLVRRQVLHNLTINVRVLSPPLDQVRKNITAITTGSKFSKGLSESHTY